MEGVSMELKSYRDNYERLNDLFPGRMSISIDECASVLGVNHKTVRETVKRVNNPIPTVKIGKRRMIPIALLARWMSEK